MTDYKCPSCGGGFPQADADNCCPWCGEQFDGSGRGGGVLNSAVPPLSSSATPDLNLDRAPRQNLRGDPMFGGGDE